VYINTRAGVCGGKRGMQAAESLCAMLYGVALQAIMERITHEAPARLTISPCRLRRPFQAALGLPFMKATNLSPASMLRASLIQLCSRKRKSSRNWWVGGAGLARGRIPQRIRGTQQKSQPYPCSGPPHRNITWVSLRLTEIPQLTERIED
jgi:hypothetical protein